MPTFIRIVGTFLVSGGLAGLMLSWPIGQAPPSATSSAPVPAGPHVEHGPVAEEPASTSAIESPPPPDVEAADESEAEAVPDLETASDLFESWDDWEAEEDWTGAVGWDDPTEPELDAEQWADSVEDSVEDSVDDETDETTGLFSTVALAPIFVDTGTNLVPAR